MIEMDCGQDVWTAALACPSRPTQTEICTPMEVGWGRGSVLNPAAACGGLTSGCWCRCCRYWGYWLLYLRWQCYSTVAVMPGPLTHTQLHSIQLPLPCTPVPPRYVATHSLAHTPHPLPIPRPCWATSDHHSLYCLFFFISSLACPLPTQAYPPLTLHQ